MSRVQVCMECSKFRVLDEQNCWSHFRDVRHAKPEQLVAAQKISCPYCDRNKALRKLNRAALVANQRG